MLCSVVIVVVCAFLVLSCVPMCVWSVQMRVATTAFDALSWQLLASVFVPGSVIHFTYSLMTFAVAHVTDASGGGDGAGDLAFSTLPAATTAALNYLPTVVGLAPIPFIVEPIDETIHKVSV